MRKLIAVFIVSYIFCVGCKEEVNNKSSQTFYVNYICKNDTFAGVLKSITSGKTAYYDQEHQLQIVPVTYTTEDHPNTHYFKVKEELPKEPVLNTIEYEIEFNDSMINNSIAFSIKKNIYTENGWKKKSAMGTKKVFDYLSEKDKYLRIIKDNVASSVFKVIVADSFDK